MKLINQSSPPKPPKSDAETTFETEEQVLAYLEVHQRHLVVELRRRKYVLVASFESIEAARECIQDLQTAQTIKGPGKPILKTNYLIWVFQD